MKKLLTILAASAMFFAFGDDINNGMDFEAYTPGEDSFPGNSAAYDPGTSDQYWYSKTYDGNVISNHVGALALPTDVTVPDLFKDDNSNTNFLYLETEAPLFRTVKVNDHTPETVTTNGVSILENPIYLDTLVKFTAADSAFESLEDAADKIAIEYVEHESEGEGDEGFTNFVIRAGFVTATENSATVVQTNYFAAVPEGFEKDAWHRLTVRSVANIDGTGTGKGHVGFVVYLDQVPLKYALGCAAGNETFVGNLTQAVTQKFYNGEIHALYPSAVGSGDNKSMISAVAFSGNGSIDDVVFTSTMPNFIKTTEEVVATFTADSGVAGISVQVGEVTNVVDMTASTLTATLPAGTTAFTVTVTADSDHGYAFDKIIYGETTNTVNGALIAYDGGNIDVQTIRNNFNLFDDNGDSLGACKTLAQALATANIATIKLAYDYTVADWETIPSSGPIYTIADGVEIVLDLNGKTLNGGSSDEDEFFYVVGAMTVIDSVGGGKIVYGGAAGIFAVEGDLAIGAATGDNGPFIDGVLYADGSGDLIRAKVSTADNTDAGVLMWSVAPGSACATEPVNGYWVVAPSAEPPAPVIPTYELTIPTVANASAAVTSNGVAVADLTAIPSNTEVLVTWTADSGYKITAGATETITMDGNKTAATPTVEQDSGDTYPDYIEGIVDTEDKAEYESKYDTWKGAYGADTGSAYATAFLLNIAPSAPDQTLEPASITISGSSVTITANKDLKSVNGKVYIKTSATLAGLETASWTAATVNTTTGAIEMTSNGTAAFFKIKVDF